MRDKPSFDFSTSLAQHSLAVAAEIHWQCSASHQSGHSERKSRPISNRPFAACWFSYPVADEAKKLGAVIQC